MAEDKGLPKGSEEGTDDDEELDFQIEGEEPSTPPTHSSEDAMDEGDAEDGEEDEDDPPSEESEETDSERLALRERRRAERQAKKRHRLEKEESLKRELSARDRIIEEMSERLARVERKSTGSEIAQIDTALKQAAGAYDHFRGILKTAVESQDGESAVQAQERMELAKRKYEDLTRIKDSYQKSQQTPQPLDPRLVNHAQTFMDENKWYDPTGQDEDSSIALAIDRRMAQEGWNPTTPEYWAELRSRVKKYLPHRAKSGNIPSTGARNERRSSPVGGSGKDSAGARTNTFILSKERVSALKEAGLWDDPKDRNDAIKRFREYDRANAQSKGN